MILVLFCESQEAAWGHLSTAACFSQVPGMFLPVSNTGMSPCKLSRASTAGSPSTSIHPLHSSAPRGREGREEANGQRKYAPKGKWTPNSRRFVFLHKHRVWLVFRSCQQQRGGSREKLGVKPVSARGAGGRMDTVRGCAAPPAPTAGGCPGGVGSERGRCVTPPARPPSPVAGPGGERGRDRGAAPAPPPG